MAIDTLSWLPAQRLKFELRMTEHELQNQPDLAGTLSSITKEAVTHLERELELPLLDTITDLVLPTELNNQLVKLPAGTEQYLKEIVSIKYQDEDDNLIDYTFPAIKEALGIPNEFEIVPKMEGQEAPYMLFRIANCRGTIVLFPPVTGWETDRIQVKLKHGIEPTDEFSPITQAAILIARELFRGGDIKTYNKHKVLVQKIKDMRFN